MRLLFDQHLSARLLTRLTDLFPGSEHVRLIGLERADDTVIWQYAQTNGFVITSKDGDFHQLSLLLGHPPKVIWLRIGNTSTDNTERVMRRHAADIASFVADPDASLMTIDR